MHRKHKWSQKSKNEVTGSDPMQPASGRVAKSLATFRICELVRNREEAQWPIGYGVGLRIKWSSVRIRPWPLRWVLGQGSLLPLSQGEAFTLASISYVAILVKYILAKKKHIEHIPKNFKVRPDQISVSLSLPLTKTGQAQNTKYVMIR